MALTARKDPLPVTDLDRGMRGCPMRRRKRRRSSFQAPCLRMEKSPAMDVGESSSGNWQQEERNKGAKGPPPPPPPHCCPPLPKPPPGTDEEDYIGLGLQSGATHERRRLFCPRPLGMLLCLCFSAFSLRTLFVDLLSSRLVARARDLRRS